MTDAVIAHINENANHRVDQLLELLRIPSVSTDPERKEDIRRGVTWFAEFFKNCGIECEIIETEGHPCIVADSGPAEGDGPTILVYGHYDVQPTGDESLWNTPAFEPTIRDGAIFARGSADDKGQVLTHLFAAESWIKTHGKLPLRVKYLIEGEEEIGSKHLQAVLEHHKDRLACDYVVLSDTPKYNGETPAITYGTKGMIYKEITLTGAKQDLHSGSFGGTVMNPGNALADIVASLKDADQRVTIPGYYEKVRELTDVEKERIKALPFSDNEYAASLGLEDLQGEQGYSTLERKWARPTLDVNGMIGGFTGEGAMTVIPARVSSKMSMRIVPDQDPAEISSAFDDAVQAACPPGIKIEITTHAMCGPYVADLDSPGMRAAERAIKAGYGKDPIFMREGGSLPILPLFKQILGADSLMPGFCYPDCNAHGPNEFFKIADLHAGTRTIAMFLNELAG
ncbi:MAG: dipeptidase [Planctomycetota bacterium]